ncbi:MAG TPA: alanine racemase C-terminal domain-containing protein, partial [Stellaceae bacterium]|nr:alanine racemase C-terminal domain-containing protein [Stellaceae bacterium]
AASYGTFLGSSYRLDMVRTGAALYGLNPLPGRANPMLPVVGLRARILQVREVEAGDTAGYGATWTAEGKRRLATLAVGYADGLLRESANRGSVRFGPMAAPIVGRVSMDLVTVDVTSVPPAWAQPGGFADLVGPHGTIEDLARDSGTIGYELLTRLGPRLRRVYEGAT